jgi:hypothetical protein
MIERTVSIAGVSMPRFLYGTAWKEEQTRPLTELALRQGFRGIDTANQRRHYTGATPEFPMVRCPVGGEKQNGHPDRSNFCYERRVATVLLSA